MLSPLSGGADPRLTYAARQRCFKPGRGLSGDERARFAELRDRITEWLAPRVDGDVVGPLMMPVLVSMAGRDAGEATAMKAVAYLIGLSGRSRNAVADVIQRTLRGEIQGFDLHFAPSPAEVASEARKIEEFMAMQAQRLTEALEARELAAASA